MKSEYVPQGVCSRLIEVEIDGDIVKNVKFTDGCNGNQKAIGMLVKGMKMDDVISKLEGIRCGSRATSCPDQLTIALKKAKAERDGLA